MPADSRRRRTESHRSTRGARAARASSRGAVVARLLTWSWSARSALLDLGDLLAKWLAAHWAAALRRLGLKPVGDAVHVEAVLALADH